MKKNILVTTLLLGVSAFSYELNFSKSFSKNVNADTLVTNVNITVEKKDEKSVNNEIEKFNNFLKNTKNITLENTNYNLSPKYEYINNKSVFKGYSGDLRFNAKSQEASLVNAFLNDLFALKDSIKSNDLKVNVSNLSWELSNKLQTKVTDELRFETLIWIEDYSKELSSKITKKCEVKNVNINEEYGYIMPRAKMMSSSMLDSVQISESNDITPLNDEQNIKINTNFVLDCK
ncbi:SIMPL domain-containing protein [Aliarcobacter lanthieri]|uniref:SIMPL domain-containing protein n=1 Tax=Aliarcobacter lanthieri TaxID=1355374 RepID=UPI00047A6B2C|nr:SIMPL domain-containing protein [Aliarcobacter lanthieri]QKF58200.1 SIMPL domain-containing protein [Aliarcobacter lanthieri]